MTLTVANDGPDGKAAATITVVSGGEPLGHTHVYLVQKGITLSKDKNYRLSFIVKGTGLKGTAD